MPSILENSIETYYPWYDKSDLPCASSGLGCLYMIAMCHVINENYKEAAKCMKTLINILEDNNNECDVEADEINLYTGMYYYLSGMSELNSFESVKGYLNIILDNDIVEKVCDLFKNPSEVIIKQYPSFKNIPIEERLNGSKSIYFNIEEKLKEAQVKNSINQQDLCELFQGQLVLKWY